jgi:serine/threonine-protein kinase
MHSGPTHANGSLLTQACLSLRRRLEAGEAQPAEAVLASFPELASDPDLAVEIICAEVTARSEQGTTLRTEDILNRFPQYRDVLRPRLERLSDVSFQHAPTRSVRDQVGSRPTELRRLVGLQVFERIGCGGMGVVYRAFDRQLGRTVALKVLTGAGDADERFVREARAAAAVDHPHVIAVYDIGRYQGQLGYTMALAKGGSLVRRRDRYAEPAAAVVLVEKIASGVAAAHAAGIVHRDLKPGNVLFDERDEPLVADFGLAKVFDASIELTRTGQVVGTPAYMAPEQAEGRSDRICPATDVWALGVMLYELVTGHRPFDGPGVGDVSRRVLAQEPTPPDQVNPGVSADLRNVILHCLEKDPARRYPTAGELTEDLARVRTGQPSLATPPARRRRASPRLSYAAALFGVVLLATLAAIMAPGFTAPHQAGGAAPQPDDPVTELQRRLERRQAITLIGRTGGPKVPLRWVGAPGGVLEGGPDVENAFVIHTRDLTHLELLPDQPLPAFALEAELRQEDASPGAEVGIFVLRNLCRLGQRPESVQMELVYNDRRQDGKRQLDARARRYYGPAADGVANHLGGHHYVPLPEDLPRQGPLPWRKLRVEVRSDGLRFLLDGVLCVAMTRPELDQAFGEIYLPQVFPGGLLPPGALPPYPHGGLGLTLYRASAAVRNVHVVPLEDATSAPRR